ncbi:MAG: flippase [Sulfurimonas sp.]|nr:MAG: flippase [Sulfurimonas sp.]
MIKRIKSLTNTEDKKRLMSNFFSLSILQGANYILPLITLPYLVRVLGVEYFGLLAFATATVTYFSILTDYGFNLTATREISIHRDNKAKVIEIFSSVMTIKVILMFVSFLLLTILVFSFEKFSKDALVYFLTFGTVIGQVLFPVWFFQGMERMKYITYLNILSKVIFTIAIFLFVQEQSDFYLVPLLTSIGFLVAGIWSLYLVKKEFGVRFELQSIDTIKTYFINSWNVFVVDFLPNLYNNFSTFFLGFFASMEIVGYYALATKLVDVLNSFIYVIRNTTYPYLAKNSKNFIKIAKITIGAGALFTVCLFGLSHLVIPLLFGETMRSSLLYLYIIGLSPLLLAITTTYGSNRMLVMKKDKEMKDITIQYSLFGFVLALVLIPFFGAVGSAVTLVSSRLLMTYLTFNKGRKL